MALDPRSTVGEIVAQRPNRSRVFERLGIDYCCGGKKPLESACTEKGLDLRMVLGDLAAIDSPVSKPETDWTKAPLPDLVEDILTTHHAYLKAEMPRLSAMARKVKEAHGRNHLELVRVETLFSSLRAELEMHMAKEEQVLFPLIRELAAATVRPSFHCGFLCNPISVMESEHETVGKLLREMRDLTKDYTTPADACNTFGAFFDGLERLEEDLHVHIHKENNILHPRSLALEESLPEA